MISPPNSPGGDIEAVLRAHYREIHAYVVRRLPGRLKPFFDPSDVVHDVCVKALKRFDPSQVSSPRAWLLTIARHEICDLVGQLRKLNQGANDIIRQDSLNRDDRDTIVMLQDLAVYRRTPSASAIRRELVLAVEKALESISKSHQTVIRMRYLDGLSTAQTAGNLGISEDAIAHLLKRALAAIRSELRSCLPGMSWTT